MERTHVTRQQIDDALPALRDAPKNQGTLDLIVRRPETEKREVLEEGKLDLDVGLVGDNWKTRGSKKTKDGSAHPEMQLNVMGRRILEFIAQAPDRWQLAGDQLIVDLDLSVENLPPGTRLEVGSAVIEVTAEPHTGCKKFVQRFGIDAMKFVNSPIGKELRMRGLNAKVVTPGTIRTGDVVRKMPP